MDKRIGGGAGSTPPPPPPPPPPTRLINEGVEIIKPQTEKIMDKRIGAGGIFAIIVGIITLGGVISIGILKRTVGTVLIMLVGIYAVSNIKGDFFGMIKDFSARSEASEIRQIELEREKMRLENETKLKMLEIETKRSLEEQRAAERAYLRQEKRAAIAAKTEAENKVEQIKQSLVNNGFQLFEKTNFREIHYKLLSTRWDYSNKIISAEIVLNRHALTTAANGLKWHSERHTLEVNCWAYMTRVSNSVVYDGPWNTGEVVLTSNRVNDWTDSRDWQKNFGMKFC